MLDPDEPDPTVEQRSLHGNGEVVLIVDDLDSIRELSTVVLQDHNYRVLAAKDGEEAIALFAQEAESIRCVLTDLRMPAMNGVALVRALRERNEGIPLIVATGRYDQAEILELKALGVEIFLSKPYHTAELLDAIDDALQAQGESRRDR